MAAKMPTAELPRVVSFRQVHCRSSRKGMKREKLYMEEKVL